MWAWGPLGETLKVIGPVMVRTGRMASLNIRLNPPSSTGGQGGGEVNVAGLSGWDNFRPDWIKTGSILVWYLLDLKSEYFISASHIGLLKVLYLSRLVPECSSLSAKVDIYVMSSPCVEVNL